MLVTDQEIARVTYAVNRAYCNALGDHSFPPWDEAADWMKEANVVGVAFHRQHPDAHPSQSHESWMRQKIADGWVYGTVKDPVAKTHPCLVHYEELPLEQRVKDYLFAAVVRVLDT